MSLSLLGLVIAFIAFSGLSIYGVHMYGSDHETVVTMLSATVAVCGVGAILLGVPAPNTAFVTWSIIILLAMRVSFPRLNVVVYIVTVLVMWQVYAMVFSIMGPVEWMVEQFTGMANSVY